jgi:ribosome recycling factor
MADQIFVRAKEKMEGALEVAKREFATLRTGRANPGLVERLQIDYYGTPTPLNQLANISTPEPRLLLIAPWDKSSVRDIEKAILKSDLGLTPTNDGQQIRIAIPPLTEERRREMVKLAKKIAEERRVAVRAARRDSNDEIKALEKKGDLPEDDSHRLQDEMQKLTDKYIGQVDGLLERKEKEIMEI